MDKSFRWICLILFTWFISASFVVAGDWPTWRYDMRRGNASPDSLPDDLQLRWTRQLPTPRTAWPASQTKLQFDAVYQPIVVGKLMIVGSTVNDSVTAYDTVSGEEVWRFFTNGPVRFAPAAHKGRIYAASDDGYMYCLDATTGSLVWKVNGGPTDRRVIGNDRLVSSWPIRGGPVIADDTVYFTASIWPFMGIFVHAVQADTGESVWTNSETGSRWITHPHGAPSFGSIVPQGYLAVAGENLVVPGGRSLPGVFDRQTGEMRHFQFGGKGAGGWNVVAHDNFYIVGNATFDMKDGSSIGSFSAEALTDEFLIGSSKVHKLPGTVREEKGLDRRGKPVTKRQLVPKDSRTIELDGMKIFAMAGSDVFASEKGKVARYNLDLAQTGIKTDSPNWSASIDGQAASMIAADDKLFIVTDDAKIHCFGAGKAEMRHWKPSTEPTQNKGTDKWTKTAEAILEQGGAKNGYAIALGIGSGRLIEEIVANSELHVIAIEPNEKRLEQFRRSMNERGMYGTLVVAHQGELATFNLPPYLANLVFTEDPQLAAVESGASTVDAVFKSLRPYGGTAFLPLSDSQHADFEKAVAQSKLSQAEVARSGDMTILRRVGALPGSAPWTHQYADAANSVVSQDTLVKPPFGLLWFGGPPNDKVLPRHGHGPSPQVAGGRLVIEGEDMLRCVDVYTGRMIWERDLPGLGTYYNETGHFPGAGEIGSNYVTLADAVYVVYRDAILQLDAATGETKQELKPNGSQATKPNWGFIAVDGDLLLATSSPVNVKESSEATTDPSDLPAALSPSQYSSASRQLVVFDRHTGKQLWDRTAEFNFRHNAIALAAGKVFCIDGMSAAKLETLKRRGIKPPGEPRLLALDLQTGKEIWSTNKDVFGTFLNYSSEHDVLLQAGSPYRDRAKDEAGKGMVAYRGADGQVLWQDLEKSYGGPCLLWRDKIITNGGGGFQLDLLSGQDTGWKYGRMYGCNTAIGGQHLLTFRSGAAGFCDLTGDSGTGNIGGFRSSCTANLVIADGVLNAPDYTRTCSCAYQNPSSLALIHMPDAESWTFSNLRTASRSIRHQSRRPR